MFKVQMKFNHNGNSIVYDRVLEVWQSDGKMHIRRYARGMSESSVLTIGMELIEFWVISGV
jgi:hypothetical protein